MEANHRENTERRGRIAARASIAAALISLLSAVIVALIGYENNKLEVQAAVTEQEEAGESQRDELIDKQKQRREAFIQNITPRLIDPSTRLPACIAAVAILEPDDRLFETIRSLSEMSSATHSLRRLNKNMEDGLLSLLTPTQQYAGKRK